MGLLIIAIILGIIEGLTEFLPISSTGHLIIISDFFSFSGDFAKLFEVFIQLGAIIAVIIYFRKKILPFNSSRSEKLEVYSLWGKVLIATISALIIGGLFGSYIQSSLFNPGVVIIALLVGGVLLLVLDNNPSFTNNSLSSISYNQALIVGLIQCLALIPGTSRAAVTIIGGMIVGFSRRVAAEFSFFLAIPIIIAASAYSLINTSSINSYELFILIIGLLVSLIVSLIVIKWFMKYLTSHNFRIFGYYRIILAILLIIYYSLR